MNLIVLNQLRSETFLTNKIPKYKFDIPGYTLNRKDRTTHGGGDWAIYFSERLNIKGSKGLKFQISRQFGLKLSIVTEYYFYYILYIGLYNHLYSGLITSKMNCQLPLYRSLTFF